MNILILGAGRVGESVAESLASEQNDITLIDVDPTRLAALQDRLDLKGVAGNGIQPSVLREAGIEDTDLFIACAPLDEANLVACKVAHEVFNVPTTIASAAQCRVRARLLVDRRAQRLRGRPGDLPGGVGHAHDPQAGRVPRGAAGAGVHAGAAEPDSPGCRSPTPISRRCLA
jgi:TrkA-N domain